MYKSIIRLGLLVMATLSWNGAQATLELVTIDFEDINIIGAAKNGTILESNGFTFTITPESGNSLVAVADVEGFCGNIQCVEGNDTQWLTVYSEERPETIEIRMEPSDGGSFDFVTMDFAALSRNEKPAIRAWFYPADGSPKVGLLWDDPDANSWASVDLIASQLEAFLDIAYMTILIEDSGDSEDPIPALDNIEVLRIGSLPAPLPANGSLEIPPADGEMSGIGIVSGWHCNAGRIEVSFNDGERIEAASGTTRADTASVCGEDNINTGYSLLWAYSLLGEGEHTATVYADGIEFDSATFTVTLINGEEYLVGANGQYVLPNFPVPGNDVIVKWSEASQSFEVVESRNQAAP